MMIKINGLKDEWYAKIMFIHPPRTGPSLQDSDTWKDEKECQVNF